jgi:hypothetical protein
MIEDLPDGSIQWGHDFGLAEGEELPENVDELSNAQYTLHQFLTTLRQIGDAELQAKIKAEAEAEERSRLVVPTSGIIR